MGTRAARQPHVPGTYHNPVKPPRASLEYFPRDGHQIRLSSASLFHGRLEHQRSLVGRFWSFPSTARVLQASLQSRLGKRRLQRLLRPRSAWGIRELDPCRLFSLDEATRETPADVFATFSGFVDGARFCAHFARRCRPKSWLNTSTVVGPRIAKPCLGSCHFMPNAAVMRQCSATFRPCVQIASALVRH